MPCSIPVLLIRHDMTCCEVPSMKWECNAHFPAACVPSCLAGLCVILVHFPALIAKSLVPSIYPLRLALFDPLTQVGMNHLPTNWHGHCLLSVAGCTNCVVMWLCPVA